MVLIDVSNETNFDIMLFIVVISSFTSVVKPEKQNFSNIFSFTNLSKSKPTASTPACDVAFVKSNASITSWLPVISIVPSLPNVFVLKVIFGNDLFDKLGKSSELQKISYRDGNTTKWHI